MEAPSNALLVSAATVWEMAIKHRGGTWPTRDPAFGHLRGLTTIW